VRQAIIANFDGIKNYMNPRQDSKPNGNRVQATLKDILGNPVRQPKINPQWREQYDRLLELRDLLSKHHGGLTEIARQEQQTFSLHMADVGTDQYDQDFALSMMSSDQNAIYEVEEALSRIRSGTYGICEVTGKPIEMERLVAIPWTRFSLEAQKQLEANGSFGRSKFGQVGSLVASESEDDEGDDEES
jgi:DnaK suppressor protein